MSEEDTLKPEVLDLNPSAEEQAKQPAAPAVEAKPKRKYVRKPKPEPVVEQPKPEPKPEPIVVEKPKRTVIKRPVAKVIKQAPKKESEEQGNGMAYGFMAAGIAVLGFIGLRLLR